MKRKKKKAVKFFFFLSFFTHELFWEKLVRLSQMVLDVTRPTPTVFFHLNHLGGRCVAEEFNS